MTTKQKTNVKPNVHEKADQSAKQITANIGINTYDQPVLHSSHEAPSFIKDTVLAVDQVLMVNHGLRKAQMSHFKNKSVNIRAKSSSITEEIEKFFTDNIVIKQKQGSKLNSTTINHRNKREIKVIDRMLVSPQPWSHTDRLDSVDLIDFRAAMLDNDYIAFNKYFKKIIDDAVRKCIPTHMLAAYGTKFSGVKSEANPFVLNNLVVLAPNLNEYTVPLFVGSIQELFPGNQVTHQLVENFDERWIDGSISYEGELATAKSKVYLDGGNDHDSGVANTSALEIIVKNPYEDIGFSVTFLACPVVSTQIGYNSLLSSELVENGFEFESGLPAISAYKVLQYLNNANSRVITHTTELNGALVSIDFEKKPLAIGDLSLVATRLQQEMISFFGLGGKTNFDLIFNTNYNQLPALLRKVFSPYNYQVDAANLFRCYEFFMRNELPGIVQNIADNSAAQTAKGLPCCTGHDDTRITISCSDYKIRAAMRSSLDFKTHQMFDGYRTGTSLLKAMFLFHTRTASMEYAIDIRAELIRIACRNMHDLYSKGYYTRLGASQSFFYDNYVMSQDLLPINVSYMSVDVVEALNGGPSGGSLGESSPSKSTSSNTIVVPKSNGNVITVPNAADSFNPLRPHEYTLTDAPDPLKLNVKYGYEFVMNSFYTEFIQRLGPNFSTLKDVVIAY